MRKIHANTNNVTTDFMDTVLNIFHRPKFVFFPSKIVTSIAWNIAEVDRIFDKVNNMIECSETATLAIQHRHRARILAEM